MNLVREQLHLFVRRFGLLNASCCETCCGEEVSLIQSHILFEIRRLEKPSMQRVAEELGIDVTTFSRQAKSLERKGLVARRQSEKDRRVSHLELTGTGERLMARIDRYMQEKMHQLFTAMTPFEREVVTSSLTLLNGALARVAADPAGEQSIACCN